MSEDSKFLDRLNAGLRRASVPHGAVLVVAFSGGPDSAALLTGLSELRDQWSFTLVAGHVNHMIRPVASDRDQLAAQRIAERLSPERLRRARHLAQARLALEGSSVSPAAGRRVGGEARGRPGAD